MSDIQVWVNWSLVDCASALRIRVPLDRAQSARRNESEGERAKSTSKPPGRRVGSRADFSTFTEVSMYRQAKAAKRAKRIVEGERGKPSSSSQMVSARCRERRGDGNRAFESGSSTQATDGCH